MASYVLEFRHCRSHSLGPPLIASIGLAFLLRRMLMRRALYGMIRAFLNVQRRIRWSTGTRDFRGEFCAMDDFGTRIQPLMATRQQLARSGVA